MPGHFNDIAQIESLVARFADCTLPCAEWTHAAHLTVGLCYLRDFGPAEALDRVREGIQRYNTACSVPNSTTRGYHETLTRFYMWAIGKHLAAAPNPSDWLANTNSLIERHGDREFPFRYYTRERLMSPAARADWLPPDLRALE